MADGWANFPSNERNQNGHPVEEDDWDDFGGFEGAEPMPAELEQQDVVPTVEASPSPWAVFSTGRSGGAAQPDLLIAPAQPTLQKMDNSFPNNAAPEVTANRGGSIPCQGAVGGPPEITMQAQASVLQAVGQTEADRNMSLKDIDVDLVLDDNLDIIGSRKTIGSSSVDSGSRNSNPVLRRPSGNQSNDRPANRHGNSSVETAQLSGRVDNLQEQLSFVDREKKHLQQELQEIATRNQQLQEELAKEKDNLEEQRKKYKDLESKHDGDIADLRKAGHDTLAIMLEEYKGLCKCAILEQQEANEERLKEALTKESERCESLMKSQHERLVCLLEEERKINEERTCTTIAELTKKHEQEIENVLSIQQQKTDEANKTAIEMMKQSHKESMEKLIAEEKAQSTAAHENERKTILEMIEKEKMKSKEALSNALQQETDKCKDAVKEALSEERKSQDEANKFAAEKTKAVMLEHLKEQKKADSAIRQRSLASIDLFLEGARQQLQMLLESPVKSSNENDASS